ncbi:MAG: hypothetical protein ACREA2_17260 [Blastocatellia bacterium]
MYRTDDRGFYRIYGLPEGRYLVSVGQVENSASANTTLRREYYPRVFYPNATSESTAKVIKVSEGSEVTNIDITAPDPKQTYDVYGRVVNADSGQPVVGVEVVVGGVTKEGRYSGRYARSEAWSGPNGEFRIFGVVPGRYAILTRPDELNSGFTSDPVIVDIGEDTGVEITVRQGATISGVVVIEGTNDPKVRAKLSQAGLSTVIRPTGQGPLVRSMHFVRANADGSFRLSGLHPGKVEISMILSSDTRDLVMSRIERNGAPVDDGIEVESGAHVTGVRVFLVHASLAIRGELRVVGGALPAGYGFFAAPRRVDKLERSLLSVEIDARGQFIIENLPPGEYEISVFPRPSSPGAESLSPEIRKLISSVKETVVLSGGNSTPIVLTLDLSRKEGDR